MCREPLSGDAVASRIDHEVLAVDEAEPPQLVEQREMMRRVARTGMQAADPINPSRFLRARRERPRSRRDAEQRDEVAPSHSITSSARTRIDVGIWRRRALAVLTLMISSTLVACWTGKSAGFPRLRIRPV